MTDKGCELCGEHTGFKSDIKTLCKFKDEMSGPGGTAERLWRALDKKISRGLLITFTIIIFGLLGTLYGLSYRTQHQILEEMSAIKIDIAVIKAKVK